MKILELGKFYPIRGGVEKVMWDITNGVSQRGVDCDMLCACEEPQVISLNEHGRGDLRTFVEKGGCDDDCSGDDILAEEAQEGV